LPDIFYLILDSYASSESLLHYWSYDNSSIVKYLRERNFNVLTNAHSNYGRTPLCIASTFGMDYLPDPASLPFQTREVALPRLIKDGTVPQTLAHMGYKLVNLSLFDLGDEPLVYPFLVYENSIPKTLFNQSLFGFFRQSGRRQDRFNVAIIE